MIHFFSCTFTGNLRTSYIVILPIFQQRACTARCKQTPTKPPRAGEGRRGAQKNISYVRFQGLLGLHVQQTHYWAFSHRNFQRNSISVQRAGINRKIFILGFSKQTQQNFGSVIRPTAEHSSRLQASLQFCTWASSLGLKQTRTNLILTANTTLHAVASCKGVWAFPAHARQPASFSAPRPRSARVAQSKTAPRAGQGFPQLLFKKKSHHL